VKLSMNCASSAYEVVELELKSHTLVGCLGNSILMRVFHLFQDFFF
jgi:hypothetical protein